MVSVGIHIDLFYPAPVGGGTALTVDATVVEIDRRRLRFSVGGGDGNREILHGIHDRFLVDLAKFLSHSR